MQGMEVGIIEFAVDLASLNLAERDLFLDILENHEEMLALLGIGSVVVGTAMLSSIMMAGRERDAKFFEEGCEVLDFLHEGEDGAGFRVGLLPYTTCRQFVVETAVCFTLRLWEPASEIIYPVWPLLSG